MIEVLLPLATAAILNARTCQVVF